MSSQGSSAILLLFMFLITVAGFIYYFYFMDDEGDKSSTSKPTGGTLCTTDADCTEGTGTCITIDSVAKCRTQAEADTACGTGKIYNTQSQACETEVLCPGNTSINDDNQCVVDTDQDCSEVFDNTLVRCPVGEFCYYPGGDDNSTPKCGNQDAATGSCTTSGYTYIRDTHACVTSTTCDASNPCPNTLPHCVSGQCNICPVYYDASGQQCVECIQHTDCDSATAICNGGTCVEDSVVTTQPVTTDYGTLIAENVPHIMTDNREDGTPSEIIITYDNFIDLGLQTGHIVVVTPPADDSERDEFAAQIVPVGMDYDTADLYFVEFYRNGTRVVRLHMKSLENISEWNEAGVIKPADTISFYTG